MSGARLPCPRPCGECPDGKHHFSDPMRDGAGNYVCKHCDAAVPACDDCGEAAWPEQHVLGDLLVCSECWEATDAGMN